MSADETGAGAVPWLAGELAGHYYHPRIIALTHTVTLGWITLTIMGASYELVPVVLERPIWSERLARWQFLAMTGGIVGVVGHFAIGERMGLVWAAALTGLAVAMHLVNLTLSIRGLARWPFTARLMAIALTGLALTAAVGWAADLAARAPFGIKTTEAPHYFRVLAQRGRAPDAVGRAGRAVSDGNGFLFIDHVGAICPSGFLPAAAGNVRRDDLVAVYRQHPLFTSLRDPSRLGGRCGRCEYRERCGGSRARAYAATGDPLAEDPGCAWAAGRAAPTSEAQAAPVPATLGA